VAAEALQVLLKKFWCLREPHRTEQTERTVEQTLTGTPERAEGSGPGGIGLHIRSLRRKGTGCNARLFPRQTPRVHGGSGGY
jgi:hypothetical protein